MPYDGDPVAELCEALLETGSVPLPWAVRWSAGGGDPLAAAWGAAFDPHWMRAVRAWCGDAALRVRGDGHGGVRVDVRSPFAAEVECGSPDCRTRADPCDPCPACADAVRRLAPEVPTMARLLPGFAAWRRARRA